MRIMIHDYAGHALYVPLSRELARRGHEVDHVFCASVVSPQGEMSRRAGDPAGLSFVPIRLSETVARRRLVRRWLQQRQYSRLLLDVLASRQPDVVISANCPSDAQFALVRSAHARNIKFVHWVQDLYGVAVHKLLRRRLPIVGPVVGRYFMRLDRQALLQSDAVVVITDGFLSQLGSWGVATERVTVIPNWAAIDEIPERPRLNEWSTKHGLDGRPRFVYAGTLAMKHSPELLLALGRELSRSGRGTMIVVSEGPCADALRAAAVQEELPELVVMPFQPPADVPAMMASADVLVCVLEADAGKFSVPSKILSYLCAGRALLLSVPLDNLAARTVREADAGLVVAPGRSGEFLGAAERLLGDGALRARLGANARRYSEAHFVISRIADRFEELFVRVCRGNLVTSPSCGVVGPGVRPRTDGR